VRTIAGFTIGRAAEMDEAIAGRPVNEFCQSTRLRQVRNRKTFLRAMATALQVKFSILYAYVLLRAYVVELKLHRETAPYVDDMARRLGVHLNDLELYLQKHAYGVTPSRRPSWETAEGRIAALQAEAVSVGR